MSITYNLEDSSIRKFIIDKRGYLKYCAECQYKVDAFWEKKEGFKYGWMGIICCKYPCLYGVGHPFKLGRGIDSDPEMLPTPIPPIEHLDGYEETKMEQKKWYEDD